MEPRGAAAPTGPSRRLVPDATALVVVDVQERFRAAIPGFSAMVDGCLRLVRTFRLLGLPVLATEQYPKGLGRTVPELLAVLGGEPVPEKTAFSSMGCAGVPERLRALGARSVVVCGIEAHVCVAQTVHDLLAAGYATHVAVDSVASRHAIDRDVALRRMEGSGAVPTTAEAAAFELMVDAAHPRFREVQAVHRARRDAP